MVDGDFADGVVARVAVFRAEIDVSGCLARALRFAHRRTAAATAAARIGDAARDELQVFDVDPADDSGDESAVSADLLDGVGVLFDPCGDGLAGGVVGASDADAGTDADRFRRCRVAAAAAAARVGDAARDKL